MKNGSQCRTKIDESDKYCDIHQYYKNMPEECPVCFDPLDTTKDHPWSCGHWTHKECIHKSGKPLCVICRKDLSSELTDQDLETIEAYAHQYRLDERDSDPVIFDITEMITLGPGYNSFLRIADFINRFINDDGSDNDESTTDEPTTYSTIIEPIGDISINPIPGYFIYNNLYGSAGTHGPYYTSTYTTPHSPQTTTMPIPRVPSIFPALDRLIEQRLNERIRQRREPQPR